MNALQNLYQKWVETNDMDYLFRAFRLALSSEEDDGSEIYEVYENIVNAYWEMKKYPSEREEFNRQLELLLLNAESYIQAKIMTFQPEYKEIGDQLG